MLNEGRNVMVREIPVPVSKVLINSFGNVVQILSARTFHLFGYSVLIL